MSLRPPKSAFEIMLNFEFKSSAGSPSLNTQSCKGRPLCSTFTFENVRSPKEIIIMKKDVMQLFDADARVFSKKFKKKHRKHEKTIKTPTKVAHNRLPTFFLYWPGCPNGPKTEIPYYKKKPLNVGLGIYTGLQCNA